MSVERILIVDDHDVVRDGIRGLFPEQADVVFGQASNAADALSLVHQDPWDIMVMDLSIGDRSGLDLLAEVRQVRPRLAVVVLTMHSEPEYARRAFKLGATAYVTKDSPREELVKALAMAREGRRYVSEALAQSIVFDPERDEDRPPHERLSHREFEVMRLLAAGRTVGEIAGILSLSDRTVSTYRTRLLEKMGLKTNADLTRYAIRNKLLD
jgi:two-component system invasion response regulator UvrY